MIVPRRTKIKITFSGESPAWQKRAKLMKKKRKKLYKELYEKNSGKVPCFVCGEHVKNEDATLEHIVPVSKGGSDFIDNLSISHECCNQQRGNKISNK